MSLAEDGRSPTLTSLDLNTLLASVGAGRFFSEYWEKHPVMFELPRDWFGQVCDIVGPLEIERLASLARDGSQAWLSNQYIEHSVFPVDAATARQYYDIGATLYFLNVPITALTDAVADALGAPRDRVVASVFLTAAESGAAPHFDKNENFTVQLTGQKTWTVAKEPTIPNPHKGYFFDQPIPPALKRLGMESERQPPGKPYTLLPGTMLYVPRGAAHSTHAKEESWSLNLSYTGLMWADLITAVLHDNLITRPNWRRSVAGLGLPSNQPASNQNIAPTLLAQLQQMLATENFVEILNCHLLNSKR